MRLHVDLDAEPRPFSDQQARRADAALAEMEIVADRDPGNPEALDQVMLNEILCRRPGPPLVERHDHRAREPRAGEQTQLGGLIRQPELGGGRAEEAPGMRLEGQRQRRPAMRLAHLERGANDRPVTEMDTVEIAHRHHGALRNVRRWGGIADHGEDWRHFGALWIGSGWGPDGCLAEAVKSSRHDHIYLVLQHMRPRPGAG